MNNNNRHCYNCNQQLVGNFCHVCGQQYTNIDLTFRELCRDFFGEMFTYDSRFYRTIVPLLFKPGFLTLEFFRGRRIPYVPPLRMYLFISFLLFLWLALINNNGLNINFSPSDGTSGGGLNISISSSDSNATPEEQATEQDDMPAWRKELSDKLSNNIAKVSEDPGPFLNVFISRLPYLMFLLLPVFALLMWLHFAMSAYNYLQHFVFTLHFHAFAYLLNLLLSISNQIVAWSYTGIALIILNVYIATAMRKSYGSSVAGCIFKTLSILAIYVLVLSFSFLFYLFLTILLL